MCASTIMANGNSQQLQGEQSEVRVEKSLYHQHPEGRRPHKGGRGHFDSSKRVEALAEQLALTDAQKSDLLTFYAQRDSLRKANRPQKEATPAERPNRDELQARFKAEHQAEQEHLKGILTEEQYAKWLETENKRQALRENR